MKGSRLLAALIAVGVLVPAASAAAPIRASMDLTGLSFVDPVLSASCGTDVLVTLDGVFKAIAFVDKDGQIVREIDTQPGVTITYTSLATTKSVSDPLAEISHTTYANGTTVGSTVTTVLTGLQGSVTGALAPGAGRIVVQGTVVAHDANGIPFVQLSDTPLSQSGSFARKTAAICSAIA
jgi:predicted aconitase with swiveling domain